MKLILGAGKTSQEGWISTDEQDIDLLDRDSFTRFLKGEQASAMVCEHVWEHFVLEDGITAAKNCYDNLMEGGYIRVAVPDGFLQDEDFIKGVGIGGPGPVDHPAYSHKILYNYKLLSDVFTKAGFTVNLLEYCDEAGDFHYHYWNREDGHIGRSFRYDTRNSKDGIGMASIIMDAHKPIVVRKNNGIFRFNIMTQTDALLIANTWKYDSPYDFYDMTSDIEDYEEFTNPRSRTNYYSVYYEDKLFGFYIFDKVDNTVDISIGIHPDHVSKGMGSNFIKACLNFTPSKTYTLSVADFNTRAIKVYEKCGFVKVESFKQGTNGSVYPFTKMSLVKP